jgi:hypothetical protein
LLYEDEDYKNNWDGGISSDGVYFYIAEIENEGIFKGYLYKIDE